MDDISFDRITRLLAGGMSRRSSIATAVSALIAGATAGADDLAAKRGAGRRHDKLPCRNAGAECLSGDECCSGRCVPKMGGTGFRCAKRHRKNGGANGGGGDGGTSDGIPTGAACTAGDTCSAADATCTAYTDNQAPSGTFCTLPLGEVCTGDPDCTCYHCAIPNGVTSQGRVPELACCGRSGVACANNRQCCSGLTCIDGECAAPCSTDVCASGCPFTTIESAYAAATAGDTIHIGAGTYAIGISITKDITFDVCPSEGEVILKPDRVLRVNNKYAIFAEDVNNTTTVYSVTLRNLVLEGTSASNSDEALLNSHVNGMISWTLAGCTVRNAYIGLTAWNREHSVSDSIFTDLGNLGIEIEVDYPNNPTTTLAVTGSSFTDCRDYGIQFDASSADEQGADVYTLSVSDCTFGGQTERPVYFEGLEDAYRTNTVATLANSTFTGLTGLREGVYFYGGTGNITGCSFTSNALDQYGHSAIYYYNASGTIVDTTISGNVGSTGYGNGLTVDAHNNVNSTVTISGTTMITGNNNGEAGVETLAYNNLVATINGTSSSNVTGNTPVNCYKHIQGTFSAAVSCDTWN